MSVEENKRIVSEGLDRRRVERAATEREGRLERYEQDMIDRCNEHCADAKRDRKIRETEKQERMQRASQRAAAAKAKAEAVRREYKSVNAVRLYGIFCLVVLLVSSITRLPFSVGVALIVSGMVFPAAYIFRLYYPIQEEARCRQ